jgi:indole-3-glycerol phosphate synthase
MLDKRVVNNIIKVKSKEFKKIKKTFDMGLIRNAAFSVGTDFNSAQQELKDTKNIPLIIPIQSKLLSGKGEIDNYEPFKLTRALIKLKLAVFLVASDREFLGGDPAHIKLVKTGAEVSVIQHDFFIDEVQLYQAKSYGSDGIVLDSEFLDSHKLALFADIAFQLGVEPFLKISGAADLNILNQKLLAD